MIFGDENRGFAQIVFVPVGPWLDWQKKPGPIAGRRNRKQARGAFRHKGTDGPDALLTYCALSPYAVPSCQ